MSCCAQSGTAACSCTATFPQVVCNPSGLPSIAYRIGDYLSFRHRLLRPLKDETALAAWQPGAEGDLAVQMIEWWAYLGDVLTFYNERIANEAYLRTALLPESVNHLVQLLGYRPRPALGSRAQLAGLLSKDARVPVAVPQGLQVQSKPGPGQQPQVFELDAPATLQAPDVVSAIVVPANAPLLGADGSSIWLAGRVTGIKAGDRLLLAKAQAINAQNLADYAWIKVSDTAPQTDPLGNSVTRVSFVTVSGTLNASAQAADYVLLRAGRSSPLWSFPRPPVVITNTTADLASIAREIGVASLVLFDVPDNAGSLAATAVTQAANALRSAATALQNSPTSIPNASALISAAAAVSATVTQSLATAALAELEVAQTDPSQLPAAVTLAATAAANGTAEAAALTAAANALSSGGFAAAAAAGLAPTPVIVSSYAEIVWYANGDATTPPSGGSNPPPPVSVPHTELSFTGLIGQWWRFVAPQVTVRFGFAPVGQIVPVLTSASLAYRGGNTLLLPAPGGPAFPATAVRVLLENKALTGASAVATPAPSPAGAVTLGTISTLPPGGLASPIDVLFNLMQFSRGKTVASEILGSGNPAVSGQDFRLSKSPVTYFADPASISGAGFSSTVKVSVDGVQWQEVPSFYDQKADAQVFVLYEDDKGATHVSFGDGVNGARLPTGTNNTVATYRTGAGAQAPAPETLTVVQTPTPGLKGVRSPLPPTGGANADPPAKLSSLAPASVLTFDRAVALDDYAAIAATAAGVTQAVAEYVFDPAAQRPVVALWIAGDEDAATQAGIALAGIAMPNQGLRIKAATPIESRLSLTYVRDPRHDDAAVQSGLTAALLDPDTGLLGVNVLRIGQAIYESQIARTCLDVPGVNAIHDATFGPVVRFFPPILRFTGRRLHLYGQPTPPAPCSGQRFDPGAGNYFLVPNDGQHLILNGAIAS